MKLIELYIENFGTLSGYSYKFSDKINPILEKNGFGKSSLADFIKVMLYGLDDSRKTGIDENDRKKYLPWQGGSFGGWLSFECRGKKYRIERTFGKKASEDTYSLFDLERGNISSDFGERAGEEIFGIDTDGFLRTVFLSEKNLSGKNKNHTISAKLSDLSNTEGDMGEFDNAIKLLDERRKFYHKKGGSGGIQDVKSQLSDAEDELRVLNSKKLRLAENRKEIASADEKILAARKKKDELSALLKSISTKNEKDRILKRYRELCSEAAEAEARVRTASAFFEKKLPTDEEISNAAEITSELSRLEGALGSIPGKSDILSTLRVIFENGQIPNDEEDTLALAMKIKGETER